MERNLRLRLRKKFQRLRFFLKRGEGTSAAQPNDEPALIVEDESQMTDRSTNLDDLNDEDWPSQDSFRVDSDCSDLTNDR